MERNFPLFSSGVIEGITVIDKYILTPFQLVTKTICFIQNTRKLLDSDPINSTESISSIRFDWLKSSLDLVKVIIKVTLYVLIDLALIAKAPVILTILVSGIGIFLLSSRIYHFFTPDRASENQMFLPAG